MVKAYETIKKDPAHRPPCRSRKLAAKLRPVGVSLNGKTWELAFGDSPAKSSKRSASISKSGPSQANDAKPFASR